MAAQILQRVFADNSRGVCYVYFMLARGANAVKIGVAHDLQQRLRDLQTANPLAIELLASVAFQPTYESRARQSAMESEQALHKRFDVFRLRGEWFLFAKPIRDLVAFVIATGEIRDELRPEHSKLALDNFHKISAANKALPLS